MNQSLSEFTGSFTKEDTRKYIAELIGTFVLVFVGCGSMVFVGFLDFQYVNVLGVISVAFAFGLAYMAMIYTIGSISGCHINPAVTVAMLIAGKIKGKDAGFYIIAQCIGAIIGIAVVLAIAEGQPSYSIGGNGIAQNGYGLAASPLGYSTIACFAGEAVMTLIFVLVIFGSTSKNAHQALSGLAIGMSLVFIHIIGITMTGASFNPARSLGPALLARGEALSQVWLFIVAPIVGAILAAVIWKYVLDTPELKSEESSEDSLEDDDEIAELMADLDSV